MYDASNRKDIRAAEKAARQDEVSRLDYLRAAMSTWQGRAWFCDLLEFCHCFVEIPSWNPHQDYFQAGQRNVGLRILADIHAHCPDEYLKMMRESNARDVERAAADARSRAASERSSGQDPGWDAEGRSDIDDSSTYAQ